MENELRDQNYFELLQISSKATPDEIQIAYDRMKGIWMRGTVGNPVHPNLRYLADIKLVLIDRAVPDVERKMRSDRMNTETDEITVRSADPDMMRFKNIDALLKSLNDGHVDLYDFLGQRKGANLSDLKSRLAQINEKYRASADGDRQRLAGLAQIVFKNTRNRQKYEEWRKESLFLKKAVSIFELGKNKVPRSRILDCVTLRLMLDLGYRSHVIEWDNPDKLLDYINRENVRSEAFSYVEEIIRCPNQDCGTPNIFHNSCVLIVDVSWMISKSSVRMVI